MSLTYKILFTVLIIVFFSACSKKRNSSTVEDSGLNSNNFFSGASLNTKKLPIIDMFKINDNFLIAGSDVDLAINLLKTENEVIRLQIYKAAEKKNIISTYKYKIPNTLEKKIKLANQKDLFEQIIQFNEPNSSKKFSLYIYWFKYFHIALVYGEDFTISYLKGIDGKSYEITKNLSYTGKSFAVVNINKAISTNNRYNMKGDVSVRFEDVQTLKFEFFNNEIYNDDKKYNFYNFNSSANYNSNKAYFSSRSIAIEKRTRNDEYAEYDQDSQATITKTRVVEIPYVDEKFKLDYNQIESAKLRGKLFGQGQQLGSVFVIKTKKMLINGVVGANKE